MRVLALLMVLSTTSAYAADVSRIERLDPRLDALIAGDAALEPVADGLVWAEGPVWDTGAGALLFSDVPRNLILRWRPGRGLDTFLRPSGYSGAAPFVGREPGSNGLALDAAGRLIICQHGDRRVVRRERDGRLTPLAERYQGRRLNSPNDVVVAPGGAIYFTDPPYGLPGWFEDPARELDFAGVFRLAADGELQAVVTDLPAPNGLALSPDGSTLYVSNSSQERPVWMAYPMRADGTLGAGRELAEARRWLAAGGGLPDGFKVDDRGNLFATGPGGVHVIAPDGTRLGLIATGRAGNVAWGDDGSVLYIAAADRILRLPTRTRGPIGGLAGR